MANASIPVGAYIASEPPKKGSPDAYVAHQLDSTVFDRLAAANEVLISATFANRLYKSQIVTVLADQAGNVFIDESPNGVDWYLSSATAAVSANTVARVSLTLGCLYSRVRYANGTSAATRVLISSRRSGA